jgi:hypothetical protein
VDGVEGPQRRLGIRGCGGAHRGVDVHPVEPTQDRGGAAEHIGLAAPQRARQLDLHQD